MSPGTLKERVLVENCFAFPRKTSVVFTSLKFNLAMISWLLNSWCLLAKP